MLRRLERKRSICCKIDDSYREIRSRINRSTAERFTFKVHNGGKIRAISLNNVIRSGSGGTVITTIPSVSPSCFPPIISYSLPRVVFIILIIVSYARPSSLPLISPAGVINISIFMIINVRKHYYFRRRFLATGKHRRNASPCGPVMNCITFSKQPCII